MPHCPSCNSFANSTAVFCAQCGERLERRAASDGGRGRKPFLLAGLGLLAAIGAVVWIATRPEPAPPERRKAPRRSETAQKSPAADDAAARTKAPAAVVDREPSPLSAAQAARLVAPALVVLELRGEEDRPLREERGVLVDSRGVVLCRYRPLLGAHQGVCRLSIPGSGGPREAKVEIRGLSFRDETLDLALVHIAYSPTGYPQVPILADPPAQVLAPGDSLFLFSDTRPQAAAVSEPYHRTLDGAYRVRLAENPAVPDAFLAIDAYGYLIGLCRFEGADGRLFEPGTSADDPGLRMLVDPAVAFANALDLEVSFTLYNLTRRFFDGTFADLFARGVAASKQKRWREAIDFFEQAIARVETDRPGEENVTFVINHLRECYHEEVQRLVAAARSEEAASVAEAGLARYTDDRALMVFLGEFRLNQHDWPGGIQPLSQARLIQADDKVDALLERAFLEFAGEALRAGDLRNAEARLLDGLGRLPESGPIQMELAKLYMRIEAFDDAVRLLQVVKERDVSLREAAQALVDRIDDTLKSRDAVVIPVPPNSRSIRTQAVIDGNVEYPFLIDTGATYTTIPAGVAQSLGYDTSRAPRINVSTAGGILSVPLIQVASVSVGGYSVRNLEVSVLPPGVGPEAGLLGLNFLKHFKYGVDARRGEFRLERP
jgi:clan AA aspartic protease (TIGR02281 family)